MGLGEYGQAQSALCSQGRLEKLRVLRAEPTQLRLNERLRRCFLAQILTSYDSPSPRRRGTRGSDGVVPECDRTVLPAGEGVDVTDAFGEAVFLPGGASV